MPKPKSKKIKKISGSGSDLDDNSDKNSDNPLDNPDQDDELNSSEEEELQSVSDGNAS